MTHFEPGFYIGSEGENGKQYLAALRELGLPPHGVKTREALGLSARQLARLAAGGHVTVTLELLLRMYLKHGLT